MKKGLMVLLVAVVCFVSQAAFAANYQEFQHRLVNDFAGTLDASSKERIEKMLRDFEKQTTNEVVVAIVPNLQGESIEEYAVNLFKKWGIGKKGKDNGLLLLIAMENRKMRLEVGYGLEGTLTDLQSGRIIDNNLKPHFKKATQGDKSEYAKGIEEGLNVVMSILVPPPPKVVSPEEKARQAEENHQKYLANLEQQRKEKEAHERFVSGVEAFALFAAGFGVFVILLVLVFKKAKRFFAERRRIRELRQWIEAELKKREATLEKLRLRTKATNASLELLPKWMQPMVEKLQADITSMTMKIIEADVAGEASLKDPDKIDVAVKMLKDTSEMLGRIENNINELDKLPEEVKKEKANAKSAINSLAEKINDSDNFAKELVRQGYLVPVAEVLSAARDFFKQLEKDLVTDTDPREISKVAKEHAGEMESLKSRLEKITKTHADVEKSVALLPEKLAAALKDKEFFGEILEQTKKNNPKEIWENLAKTFAGVETVAKTVTELVASATAKNSMQEQKFSEASKDMNQANDLVDSIIRIFSDIQKKSEEIEKAKKGYAGALATAEELFEKAKQKVRHEDVESGTKNRIREIEGKLTALVVAKQSSSDEGNLINWLAVMALVSGVIAYATQTIKQAESDISAAELVRQRAAEELRRRQREEEEEDRRRRQRDEEESSRRSSDSSSSSSSSSSISLGGGGSGGGGASGDW